MLTTEDNGFLPIFSLDCMSHLRRLERSEGKFGILTPINSPPTVMHAVRACGLPFYIDSGVFKPRNANSLAWHERMDSKFARGQWMRAKTIAHDKDLRIHIQKYFEKCDRFQPDFVFAPDVIGRPLESLHIAKLALQEFRKKRHTYELIGVVQIGDSLYNWQNDYVLPIEPGLKDVLLHYHNSRSFLAPLISQYRALGYQKIALGGLLKQDKSMPLGLRFGLSAQELDELLSWARPDFVLGGLSLSRAAVLKKHGVPADSTNWMWWTEKYDSDRFGERTEVEELYYAANFIR